MFVRMSFTITMTIFGVGLICFFMFGHKNQSTPVSELQGKKGLETQKRLAINTLSAETTVLRPNPSLKTHEHQLMAYGEGIRRPNGLTSLPDDSLELWCHPALEPLPTKSPH